jgi:hypothetical protein
LCSHYHLPRLRAPPNAMPSSRRTPRRARCKLTARVDCRGSKPCFRPRSQGAPLACSCSPASRGLTSSPSHVVLLWDAAEQLLHDVLSHPDLRANPNARIHVRQDQVTHMHRLSEYQKHSVKRKKSIKQLLHDQLSQVTTVRVSNSGKVNTHRSPPQAADWRTNA